MALVYLIRHGQTAWNKEMIFRGRKDLPLSDFGNQQAEAVANALEGEELAGVYASPMIRAVETIAPLAKRKGMEIVTVPGLIDADFGLWQGLTVPEVEKRYPELFANWIAAPHLVTFPEGEVFLDVAMRATEALKALAAQAGEATIAVVAHRFINKVIVCSLLGIADSGFWKIKQDTACINSLVIEGDRIVLESLNYTEHLRTLKTGKELDF